MIDDRVFNYIHGCHMPLNVIFSFYSLDMVWENNEAPQSYESPFSSTLLEKENDVVEKVLEPIG